jgi:hypothetical protein
MGARTRTLLAWSLWLATLGCLLGGLVVTLLVTRPLTTDVLVTGAFNGALWLLFATIGLVLTLRRPENPIGWLYATGGLVWSLYVPFDPWVDALQVADRPPPLGAMLAAVIIGDSFWAAGIALAVTLPLLLLPDGRLRSRRWQVVLVATVAGAVMNVIGWWFSPQPMTQTLEPLAKPFGLAGGAGSAATVVHWAGFALTFATIPAATLSVVLRFRASRGVERQQLRWVAAGATVAVAGPLLLVPLDSLGLAPADSFSWPLLLSVPLAIAVAVLRYRLWDLDRLVSRTVTYALVTALLLVPYLVVVPAASGLFEGAGSLAVAAATLAVAALFQPLRRRVRDLVDRRFNRRRYDAARTVEGFAARLRDQVDLDALHGELLAVVTHTMQPTTTSLWLRRQGR